MTKPKIGLYWCSSCGGCEESVVDLAEDILTVVEAVDIVFWPVAMDFKYADVEAMQDEEIVATLINGAIRTDEQEHIAKLLRKKSKLIKIMKGRDEAAAVNAPHAMGAFGARAEAAVPDLIEALKNTDLAMHAACGLGDIGPAAKEAVAALEVVARRRDRAGEEAAAALLKIRQ